MAFSANDKALVAQYFQTEFNNRGSAFGLFLVDFLLLSKNDQKALVISYLNGRKTANTTQINNLDMIKNNAETALTSENTTIDGILAQL